MLGGLTLIQFLIGMMLAVAAGCTFWQHGYRLKDRAKAIEAGLWLFAYVNLWIVLCVWHNRIFSA